MTAVRGTFALRRQGPRPAAASATMAAARAAMARAAVAVGVLAVALLFGACGAPGRAAAGIVIAVDASGGAVTGFTLRTPEGDTIPFAVGDLEVDGAAFAASHLSEHAITLQPIAVAYRVVDGRNVVHRMVDAPWAGPSP